MEQPRSRSISFGYIDPLPLYSEERPYYIYDDIPEGTDRGNLRTCYGPSQQVENLRYSDESFDIDQQGFMFKQQKVPNGIDWNKENDILSKYIPNVQGMVADILGDSVHCCKIFDWRVSEACS